MLANPVIPTVRKPRGFAALKARGDIEQLRAISRAGSQRARQCGTAHRWTPAEAKAARAKRNSRPLSAVEGEQPAA